MSTNFKQFNRKTSFNIELKKVTNLDLHGIAAAFSSYNVAAKDGCHLANFYLILIKI